MSAGILSLLNSVGIFIFYNGLEEMETLEMLEEMEMQSLLKRGGDGEP